MKWYVIQVVTGKENKTRQLIESEIKINNLGKYVNQILIPKETYYRMRNGKKTKAEKNYFPGYIMIEADMNGELSSTIKFVDGVCGFLGSNKKDKKDPIPLRPNEVKRFLQAMLVL
jgi:transcriptional antiterminator NusG